MLANNYVKQIIEFDTKYVDLRNMVYATNFQILMKTELEDKFNSKDYNVGMYFSTFDYIIFCNN
jgi:hypothetical protein